MINGAGAKMHSTFKSSNQKWLEEVDLLRGFAVLAVLLQHTSVNFASVNKMDGVVIINAFTYIAAQFAVPLFIVISGLVLSRKYSHNFSLVFFYKQRALSVIPQYLFFSVAYTIFFSIRYGKSLNMHDVVVNILTTKGSSHLWFFSILLQLYALYPLIITLYNKADRSGKTKRMLVLALAIQIMFNIIALIMKQYTGISSLHMVFLSHWAYFVIGIHLGNNLERFEQLFLGIKLPRIICLSVVMTIVIEAFYVAGLLMYKDILAVNKLYFIGPRIIEPFLSLSVMVILLRISIHLLHKKGILFEKMMHEVGKKSFGIYLVNVFFIVLLTDKIKSAMNMTTDALIFYPVLFLGTLLGSYAGVSLIRYLPYSNMIIGRLPSRHE
ncbi:MAG: acyltransferase [Dissulfurispiraceae bacterium]